MEDLIDKISKIKWKSIMIGSINSGYEIAENGMVRNSKRMKILNPTKTQDGFLQVNLYVNGKYYTKKIHQLVANAFLPNQKRREKVSHKNGDRSNNDVSNLEWSGPFKGQYRSFPNRAPDKFGEYSPASYYNSSQIARVCELLSEGKLSYSEIASATRVQYQTVLDVKNRKSWRCISENFYFPSKRR